MNKKLKLRSVGTMLMLTSLVGGLAGCVDEKELNTDTVVYQAEERPLGVIAGEGAEYEPGSTVALNGRLVGTVTGQTLLWKQTSGTPIDGVADWTSEDISFTAPDVLGIESFTFEISAIASDGSVAVDDEGNPLVAETKVTVFDPATKIFYQVEDNTIVTLNSVNLCSVGNDCQLNGASGQHTLDFTPGASAVFTITSTEDKFVTLYGAFGIPSSGYGSKNAIIAVNGVETEIVLAATGTVAEYRIGVIKLNAGDNLIEVGGGWNYYRLDYLMTVPAAQPPAPLAVAPTLVNANASSEAKDLMSFLTDNYGTATLTGQTEFPSKVGDAFPLTEYEKIVTATGDDAPSIVAFDYMNFSSSYSGAGGTDYTGLTESIIAEHNDKNIIVSALYHWRAPSGNKNAEGAFYTDDTDFDLAAALADTSSAEYAELLVDIDIVAGELQKLEDAGIPVLWRPLHEAEGAWFWWGAQGSAALKELWVLMYDRMTTHHGLDNLIWVFTHTQSLSEDWYPGDMYVDIVGYDGYASTVNDPTATFKGQYSILKTRHNGEKLVALTETGTIPSIAAMHEQDAWWSFFITWNSEFWNTDSLIGPQGADAAVIDANYAFDGAINLADIPGGRIKVEPGIFQGFEPPAIASWEAQVNWSPTDGIGASTHWAESGLTALTVVKDMTAIDAPDNIVFQTYPADGLDVSGADKITIYANTLNAGSPNVHVFVKHADGEMWPDPVDIGNGGVTYEVDISAVDMISGYGVRFQNLDVSATAAEYFIDKITLTDVDDNETVINDFEPSSEAWENQIAWSGVAGTSTSTEWSASGMRSLAFHRDLVAHGAANDVVFQTYPEGGIDVTGKSALTINVNALNVGGSANAHIFFKAPGEVESWPAAVDVTAGGVELTIDVAEVDSLNGIGVRFNGVDAASTDAKFFIDNIQLDGSTLFSFEGTSGWGFQTSWSPTPGLHVSSDWSAQDNNALAAKTDATADIVFQVYPSEGLLLGDVSTMKITVNAIDAGADVNAHIFWKSPSGDESWPAAVAVTDGGVELSIDLTVAGVTVNELSGFGVRFQAPNNTSADALFLIDNIVFE